MGLQLTVVEISPRLSAGEAAHVIQKHRVLVLVNLNGWTLHDRNDVFALQPSPVQARVPPPTLILLLRSLTQINQVGWLGYPASTGCRYMTHVLVDSLVAPPDHAAEFSESIVLLPPTFYVNDHMQYFRPEIRDAAAAAIAAGDSFLSPNVTRRVQHGLPPKGTVMANFNQPYKMNSASARAACLALASSANTTWWASDGPAVYRAAVLAACRRLGVSSSRILFSPPVGIIEFAERLGAADVSPYIFIPNSVSPLCSHAALSPSPLSPRQLFIDTVPLGAHTVAMDALALGTPIVAVAGTLYAHRVSSSILAAAGAMYKRLVRNCTHSRAPGLSFLIARNTDDLYAADSCAVSPANQRSTQVRLGIPPAAQHAAAAAA